VADALYFGAAASVSVARPALLLLPQGSNAATCALRSPLCRRRRRGRCALVDVGRDRAGM